MQTIFKRNNNSGFTLIELMVVVVLVIVLASALVPTFKELVTKAKYAEGISAISAINTKIKVYQVEKSCLPGCITNAAHPDGISAVGTLSDLMRTQRFLSSTNMTDDGNRFLYTTGGDLETDAQALQQVSPIQLALDIDPGTYDGKYFRTTDYQVRIDGGGLGVNYYMYTVAVAGNGDVGKAPIGTAYAVMTYYNPGITDSDEKTVIATFSRYKPQNSAAQMVIGRGTLTTPGTDKTMIFVPDFLGAAALQGSAGSLNRAAAKNVLASAGFSMD